MLRLVPLPKPILEILKLAFKFLGRILCFMKKVLTKAPHH